MSSVVSSVTRMGLDEPFHTQVGRGQITGHTVVNINGFQAAVPDDGNFYPLWENATIYKFLNVAQTLTMVSTDPADVGIKVLINGLDASYNPLSETITLNGTTGVATVNSYFRVNSLVTVSGNATGTVTLATGVGGIIAQINAGLGRSQMSIYTVPANRTFYLQRIQAWCGTCLLGQQYAVYRLQSTTNGVGLTQAEISFFQDVTVTRVQPSPYPAGTDIVFEFATGAANGGTAATQEIAVYVEGLLIVNDGQAA